MDAGRKLLAGLCVCVRCYCGCAFARAQRVSFGLYRSRKPARACLCAASGVPGCRVLHDTGLFAGLGCVCVLVVLFVVLFVVLLVVLLAAVRVRVRVLRE